MSLYLILNTASFLIPFLYSFERRMYFVKRWKAVFIAIAVTAVFFIIWDIIFTQKGVWSFNPKYHTGFNLWGLPLEEWLFFFCIPYASLFIHFAFRFFFPDCSLSNKGVKYVYWLIMALLVPTTFCNSEKAYTVVNYTVLIILLSYTFFKVPGVLNTFFISFLIVLIPFSVVNGILTGSFIEAPVVIYNDKENLGIRLGTIPIEDIGYAFSMLLSSVVLINKIEKNESL